MRVSRTRTLSSQQKFGKRGCFQMDSLTFYVRIHLRVRLFITQLEKEELIALMMTEDEDVIRKGCQGVLRMLFFNQAG